jgi:hypothetical protein
VSRAIKNYEFMPQNEGTLSIVVNFVHYELEERTFAKISVCCISGRTISDPAFRAGAFRGSEVFQQSVCGQFLNGVPERFDRFR